ncbi:MAG TPA: hypothetical protein VF026_18080 [Ktedonobacteraceae bacterium]
MTPSQTARQPIPLWNPTSSKPRTQRRLGPAHPRYGIPPVEWPDVLRRIEEGESLRQVAQSYRVSYETIRRVLRAMRRQATEGQP